MGDLLSGKFFKNSITRYILFILIVGALTAFLFEWWRQTSSPRAAQTMVKVVTVQKAQRKDIQEKAQIIATIESLNQTILRARSSGIINLRTSDGQSIKRGEIVAVIRNRDQERAYETLKEANHIAHLQAERAIALGKINAISKTMVEDKKLALLEAQKRVADAAAALEENRLRAPFNGMVGFFKFKDGSQVSQGNVIVQLYNPASLIVRFDLPLPIAQSVKKETNILVDGIVYPLTHLQKMVDSETHMCPAYAHIECPTCIVGSTTEVEVVIREHKNVIVIPFEAIFLKEGNPFVYIASKDKAILRSVTFGIRNQQEVEIMSGLQEGDSVITEGQSFLYDGAPVRVVENSLPEASSKMSSSS